MKGRLNNLLVLLMVIFSACNDAEKSHLQTGHEGHEGVVYTCPMHPEVEGPQPGTCPICKMNLELKSEDPTEQIADANKQVLSRQSTVKLSSFTEGRTTEAQGYIDFDRTRSHEISVRFGGRIEKLFVKYEYQYLKAGDPVLELYSPEMNTFQEEHLFLLKSNQESSLLEQSRQKLKLLGITDLQISDLENKGTVANTITVYSPVSGYVLFNSKESGNSGNEIRNQASMNGMSRNEQRNPEINFSSSDAQIREGVYVNKGESLFTVNDLRTVWVLVSVPAEFHSEIESGGEVKIASELFPGKTFSGKIALTERSFEDSRQKFIRVRIEMQNDKGELKINSLVTAKIPLLSKGGLQLPRTAVFRTGMNSYVWVRTGKTKSGTGIFKLRRVITGKEVNGMIAVISGISAADEVAAQAGYLTDSETFLNVN